MKNNEGYYMGGYWENHPEKLEEIVKKTIVFFDGLRKIDSLFENWLEKGKSRKQALLNKIEFNEKSIYQSYMKNLKKEELSIDGYSKFGFQFSGWSGHEDNESVSFSLSSGHLSSAIPNRCLFNFPSEGNNKKNLIQAEKLESILKLIVSIWNPDYAVFSSTKLREKLGVGNRLGWISYNREHGMHSIDTGNEYDSDNESHLEAIRAVKSFYVPAAV